VLRPRPVIEDDKEPEVKEEEKVLEPAGWTPYDAHMSAMEVYAVYHMKDAHDSMSWVNPAGLKNVEMDYFRACIHFYNMSCSTFNVLMQTVCKGVAVAECTCSLSHMRVIDITERDMCSCLFCVSVQASNHRRYGAHHRGPGPAPPSRPVLDLTTVGEVREGSTRRGPKPGTNRGTFVFQSHYCPPVYLFNALFPVHTIVFLLFVHYT
jgi:hypothetical protein